MPPPQTQGFLLRKNFGQNVRILNFGETQDARMQEIQRLHPRTRTSKRNIAQHCELKNVSRRSLHQSKNNEQNRKFDSTVRDAVQCCALAFGCAGTDTMQQQLSCPLGLLFFLFFNSSFCESMHQKIVNYLAQNK